MKGKDNNFYRRRKPAEKKTINCVEERTRRVKSAGKKKNQTFES